MASCAPRWPWLDGLGSPNPPGAKSRASWAIMMPLVPLLASLGRSARTAVDGDLDLGLGDERQVGQHHPVEPPPPRAHLSCQPEFGEFGARTTSNAVGSGRSRNRH